MCVLQGHITRIWGVGMQYIGFENNSPSGSIFPWLTSLIKIIAKVTFGSNIPRTL